VEMVAFCLLCLIAVFSLCLDAFCLLVVCLFVSFKFGRGPWIIRW
jgi:hypothetical protein